MSRTKKKPIVLVLEGADPSQNIILALDDLEKNNSRLKRAMTATGNQIGKLREILKNL
jgi:hypothetical protein